MISPSALRLSRALTAFVLTFLILPTAAIAQVLPTMRRWLPLLVLLSLPVAATAQVLPYFPTPQKGQMTGGELERLRDRSRQIAALAPSDTTLLVQLRELSSLIESETNESNPARLLVTTTASVFENNAARDSSNKTTGNASLGLQLQMNRSQWDLMVSIAATEEEVARDYGASIFAASSAQRGMLVSYQSVRPPRLSNGGSPPQAFGWTAQLSVSSMRWRDSMGSAPVVVGAGSIRGTYDLFRASSEEDNQTYGVRFDAGLTTRGMGTGVRADRLERRRILGSDRTFFAGFDVGMSVVFGQALLGARYTHILGRADINGLSGPRFGTSIVIQPKLTQLPVRFR